MIVAMLLFLIGVLLTVFTANSGFEGPWDYALSGFGLLAFLAALSIVFEGKKRQQFSAWLRDNRTQVLSQGAQYEGTWITHTTELCQFHLAFSVVAFSFRIPSRYYIAPASFSPVGMLYSLTSAVCGWWGIPSGPVFTCQALWWNLRGGTTLEVVDVLAEIDREEENIRSRPAFLCTQITGQHKLALGLIAFLLVIMALNVLFD